MKYVIPFEDEELLPIEQVSTTAATSETAAVGTESQPEKKPSITKVVIPLLVGILLVILLWRWNK